MPGIEVVVKIVDPETGEHLRLGEPGELCCRGYNVMKGYYKMPEATAKAIDAKATCIRAIWALWTKTATSASPAASKT